MSDGLLSSSAVLAVGLVLLVAGAEWLVRGAARLASAFGVTPLMIGLTVVAFGTSAPELAVSVQAGLDGFPNLAVGNVVGSNIFNVLLILGLCALVLPLTVAVPLVRREVPVMIAASVVVYGLALDGRIGHLDGLVLAAGLALWLGLTVIASRRDPAAAEAAGEPVPEGAAGLPWATVQIAAGLALLVLGARLLVDASSAIARGFGVSDLVVGLSIVAAGTSLPELATSFVASLRGQRDIAIGNVVGSNIFNLLGILGVSSLVVPGGLTVDPTVLAFDLPVMIGVAVVCLPIFFTGFAIVRWEGVLLLLGYVAYTAVLILSATDHPDLRTLTDALLLTAPLVAIVLAASTAMAIRGHRRGTRRATAEERRRNHRGGRAPRPRPPR